MPSFSYFPLLLFLPLLFSTFHADIAQDLVPETCRKLAENDPNLSYNFCLTSLQAVNRGQCADLRDLGLMSIKLTKSNVTNTRYYVKKLLKNTKWDPFIRACLNDCLELYSDAIPTLKQAMKDFKSKHYEDANIEVSSVIDAATTCEDGFKEREGAVSPLTKRNNDTFQLSAIVLAVISMLH
ncbi:PECTINESTERASE INHIBITOR-LIKE [Salix purpurea]|uniref:PECTINESTERASE INHIBITOR-LIKE n=1 Tax=Salix purpurea TaxID=77065 RepID=A0A9Q0P0F9_SALPP|nr:PECTINESTERASE INHIBITOR-LIKE [Salix purpurea]